MRLALLKSSLGSSAVHVWPRRCPWRRGNFFSDIYGRDPGSEVSLVLLDRMIALVVVDILVMPHGDRPKMSPAVPAGHVARMLCWPTLHDDAPRVRGHSTSAARRRNTPLHPATNSRSASGNAFSPARARF